MTAAPVTGSRSDARYPWVVMAIVLCGTYLVVLDTTVLGVALASIAGDLHAERSVGIDWVITSYLIAVGVVQPASATIAAVPMASPTSARPRRLFLSVTVPPVQGERAAARAASPVG